MNAAAQVAEERAFEMNAKGAGGSLFRVVCGNPDFDGVGEAIKNAAGVIHGCGDGGWKISGYAASGEKRAETIEIGVRGVHQVYPSSAVDVEVQEARDNDAIGEIEFAAVGWKLC